jgi:hypothetical protein
MPVGAARVLRTTAMDTAPKRGRIRVRRPKQLLTLSDLDQRTRSAALANQLLKDLQSDAGGRENLSAAQRQLIQRAAILGALIEHSEVRWSAGQSIDLASYLAAINTQRRVLVSLGLERRQRDVTPDLSDYINSRAHDGDDE